MSKVSFVCTTYRRATCVSRVLKQYLNQTYQDKELIIFNTDTDHPITLSDSVDPHSITIINNATDYLTGLPYSHRGQICRDAVTHATGQYFMLADDDDLYLPWHMEQAVDKLLEVGKDAWKPRQSFFMTPNKLELVVNVMEASVIVKMSRIREIGFGDGPTGHEGLAWYRQLRDERQLNENYTHCVSSYCFNWSDDLFIGGHKQSGDINNPNNFENHKQKSLDYARDPIEPYNNIDAVYAPIYTFMRQHRKRFPRDMMQKYANRFLE